MVDISIPYSIKFKNLRLQSGICFILISRKDRRTDGCIADGLFFVRCRRTYVLNKAV